MDRRDRELLEKQMRRTQPPPRNEGTLLLAAVALFLAGMTFGFVLFAHRTPPTQTAANEAAVSASHGQSAPTVNR